MSQPQPSLWWAYDPDNGSFSALPASPLMLPALLILLVATLGRALLAPVLTREQIVGAISQTSIYKSRAARLQQLSDKRANLGDLEINEWREYYDLEFYLNNPHH